MPRIDTFYYAKAFQIPKNLTQKRHIVKVNKLIHKWNEYLTFKIQKKKYEFVLPKINTKNIHHLLIYECKTNYDGSPAVLIDKIIHLNLIWNFILKDFTRRFK